MFRKQVLVDTYHVHFQPPSVFEVPTRFGTIRIPIELQSRAKGCRGTASKPRRMAPCQEHKTKSPAWFWDAAS